MESKFVSFFKARTSLTTKIVVILEKINLKYT